MSTPTPFVTAMSAEEKATRSTALIQRLLLAFLEAPHMPEVVNPWIDQIRHVTPLAGQVLIAVIGATGDGKSSVINSLLDEKKLIPTSGMRACTSVVTEISYNRMEGPDYRAQIEFISSDEWRAELSALLEDLDCDQNSINDRKSAAAVASSKIQAVYPSLTEDIKLSRNHLELLMAQSSVTEVLGTHIHFEDDSATKLHDKLKEYIDSKEKGAIHSQKAQLWPLIRKVSIQTRAKALETGSVIVDLPGLLDSNAARAAIAKQYLQRCHVVWFVAAIIRASDSALARTFFDQELKRQLHLDGTIDRVTFICSKTDDIKTREVRTSLVDAGVSVEDLRTVEEQRELVKVRQKDIGRLLADGEAAFQEVLESYQEAETHLRSLNNLRRRARRGEEIYPLRKISPESRKRSSQFDDGEPVSKRTRLGTPRAAARQSVTVSTFMSTGMRSNKSATFVEDKFQAPLRTAEIDGLIEHAEDGLRDLRNDLDSRRDEVSNLQEERRDTDADIEDLLDREWQICVALRNAHVKDSVRQEFAKGINDFYTQKFADDVEFDPSQHVFTESEQAITLPIYCVSARGYEELSGWHRGSNISTYFSDKAQTELPALVEHARQLGEARQDVERRTYINKVRSLLISIRIWTNVREKVSSTNSQALFSNKSHLNVADQFWTEITNITRQTFEQVKRVTQTRVVSLLVVANQRGARQALKVIKQWHALAWGTYKAACRRQGVYTTGTTGPVNFNNDLAEPFMQHIAVQWARLFNQTLASILNSATAQGNAAAATFNVDFVNTMEAFDCTEDDIGTFREQLTLFLQGVDRTLTSAREQIQEAQKVANRRPAKQIQSDMSSTYHECACQSGQGMHVRMKEEMHEGVTSIKDEMFAKIQNEVDTSITEGLNKVTAEALLELDLSWKAFREDCANFLSKVPTGFTVLPSDIQQQIRQILDEADIMFGSHHGRPVRLLTSAADADTDAQFSVPEAFH